MVNATSERQMLGQGLYDAVEVGRLLGHDAGWAVRWSTGSSTGAAVVMATFDRYFSFADLLALRVAAILRERRVSDRHLRRGVALLRQRSGHRNPLALQSVISSLATSGSSFLSNLGATDYEDIGQGGQGVFQEIIRIDLTRLEFGGDGEPTRWEPADGVVIDPAVQAGAPCVAGTRVPTSRVAQLLAVDGTEIDEIADDFDLTVEAVKLADQFERSLASGIGLAA